MNQTDTFLELSALLTGLHNLVEDPEDRRLSASMADEYRRRLAAVFGERLERLVTAYEAVRNSKSSGGWSPKLLERLRETSEFKDDTIEFVARQIVNVWYFSQFVDTPGGDHFFDGGFYERGAIWKLIKTHPIGFSNQPHGYWTRKPD